MVTSLNKMDFLDDEHVSVMGRTRHGKTFGTVLSAGKSDNAVLFFNTQHERSCVKDFMTFDPNKHHLHQLLWMIKQKKKINFLPSTRPNVRDKQLIKLVDFLYDLGEVPCLCIWDETHLFKQQAEQQLVRLATTGLRWNKPCVFLTQRPAMMNNNLFSQSTRKIIFQLDDVDYSYLKEKGWKIDKLATLTNEKYLFVDHDGRNLKGAFKIRG